MGSSSKPFAPLSSSYPAQTLNFTVIDGPVDKLVRGRHGEEPEEDHRRAVPLRHDLGPDPPLLEVPQDRHLDRCQEGGQEGREDEEEALLQEGRSQTLFLPLLLQ